MVFFHSSLRHHTSINDIHADRHLFFTLYVEDAYNIL